VRRVRTNGDIKWRGGLVYLSEALRGEPVGLAQLDERYWSIRFGPLHIGLLDNYSNRTVSIPTQVSPMCPVAQRG
jgi:putative transposase